MLIDVFRRRVLEEIEAQGLTVKDFATQQLKLVRPLPRFTAMLNKPSIRMRWIDPIAKYLGKIPSQLLVDGLEVGEGSFPPCRDTIKESVMKAFADEGLTLRQVAKSMGITFQYLSKDLCTGNPGLDRIEQIANVVEIEPWRLILPVGTTVWDTSKKDAIEDVKAGIDLVRSKVGLNG